MAQQDSTDATDGADDGDDTASGRSTSRFRPKRRTVLGALAAGAAGAAASNPGAVADAIDFVSGLATAEQSILDLVPEAQATHRAVQTGSWDDPETWDQGEVPGDGAHVLIEPDVTVTISHVGEARLKTVRVDGRLSFDPSVDTHLLVDTLVTTTDSTLEIGTETEPIEPAVSARITFIDDGPIDESWDPERVSRGLATFGDLSIHGAEKTTWTSLAAHPTAGDEALELREAPTNWAAGETIVVPGVSALENQDEERTIASVDGATVRLDRPLEHDHVPPADDLDAYVLALDRNVRLASENDGIPRRGHVIVQSATSDVHYAAFDDLGRTNKDYAFTDPVHGKPPKDVRPNPRARYALHFHVTGISQEPPHTVEGVAINGSPGWGIVNHHSHVDVVESVTYQVFGAGFVAEAGNERGSFKRNFALRSEGSGELPDSREFDDDDGDPGEVDDFGHGGHGFWLQGPAVEVEDNVAAGHRHFAFAFWNRGLVDRPLKKGEEIGDRVGQVPNFPVEYVEGQAPLKDSRRVENGMVPSSFVRIRSFEDNTAFASGGGLDVARHMLRWSHTRYDEYGTIDGFTAYEIGPLKRDDGDLVQPNRGNRQGGNNGITVRYSTNVKISDARLIGRGPGVAVNRNTPYSDTLVVENSTIRNWKIGVRPTEGAETIVRGNTFDNQVDVDVLSEEGTRVSIYDNEYGPRKASNVKLRELETDFEDVDPDELFDERGGVELRGRTVYYPQQRPGYVPVPTKKALKKLIDGDRDRTFLKERVGDKPRAIVGKTNRQLESEYGLAVKGGVRPDSASRHWLLDGGLIEATDEASPANDVWLEAEGGDVGDLFDVESDPNASNETYIVVKGTESRDDPPLEGGIATYEFETAKGQFTIHGRVFTPHGRSLWIRVDGGEWLKWGRFRNDRGFDWEILEEAESDRPRTFDFDGGTHRIDVGYRGNRVRFDKLLIASDATTPVGPGHDADNVEQA